MIKIFNANKELTLISKNQLDFKIEHELDNGDKTLTFFVPISSKEAEIIEQEGYIQTKEQEYVIKEVNKNNNSFNVVAKLNLEEFEGKPHKIFESRMATIEEAINLAIVGTGWIVAYSNITKKRTIRKVKIDTLELIQHIKKIYNAELMFNALEKKIYIYNHIGSYKGAYVRENINLTQLSGQSNSYDFYTRVEAEGADGLTFADINNGKSYVENYSYSNKVKTYFWKDERYTNQETLLEDARIKLEEMARPRFSYSVEMINLIREGKKQQNYELGDTIELVSKTLRVKELQRIVKLVEYPYTPEQNYVELSNTLYSLEDINNKFEETVETVANITNQDGTIDGSLVDSIETSQIKDLEQTVNLITADKATVGQIDAVHAIIGELESTKASITQLESLKIIVGEIDAGKANITDLSAINAIIETLHSNVGRIENLLSSNISGESGQLIHLTANNVVIADAVIKDLIAANISVEDLKAGTISTNKFRIVSDSGKMLIADNTIQIRDNNRVRVQIGKDGSNDYNMYVWDSQGKLMFDATGLKADGIKNKIIRDDMISDNANIDGAKININSLITEINKDTNTSVIKSSKVQIDSLKQTLDVAFNSLKTQADSTKSLTESHSTTIGVMQGQINTAINNTQIVKDGKTILLKDDYNRTISKVNSINSTIGTHTTKLNELTGSISSVDTKINSVQRDLEGTKSTVSSHTSQINGLNSTVGTQGSSINQLKNEISLKVEQTDINNAVTSLKIGGDNILRNGNFAYSMSDWSVHDMSSGGTSKSVDVENGGGDWKPANKKVLVIRGTNTTNRYGVISSTIKLIPKTKYTISGYCAGHRVNKIQVNVRDRQGSDVNIHTIDINPVSGGSTLDKWCRFETTFTTTSNTDFALNLYSVNFADNGYVWFCDVQIQQGTKASAWIPCSADIDNSISNVQTQVTTTSNKVATIETNLNSITQRISSTESTVSTHTSQLTTVDSRINTAKNSAISTAASDATTKANNAQSKALADAKSYTNGQITTVNKTITDKVAEIKTTTDSITQRVSSAETKVNTVTANFNNLQVGGRNLAQLTSNSYSSAYTNFTGVTNTCPSLAKVLTDGLSVGDTVTIRLVYKYTNIVAASGQTAKCWIQGNGDSTGWGSGTFTGSSAKTLSGSGEFEFLHSFKITSEHLKNTYWNTSIRHDYVKSGSVQWKLYKVEKGNKATDWTPAPEDIDSSISNVQRQVTTTSNKVATIETNLNSITSRVSSTESTVTTINGNVTSLQSRMTTAEQKITPTAITTTISSAISGGTSSISTTQFVMDKNGLTIKNGALTIKNKSGTTVLNSDTSGNLIITGEMRSQYGQQWVGLNAGGLTFQNSQRNEQMLRVGLAYYEANRDMNGIEFAMPQYSDFIRFSHISKADLNNGWSSSDTSYNFFELWSGTHTFGGSTRNKGMTVNAPLYINKGIKLYSGTNHLSEIGGAASWNNGTGTVTNMLGVYGDNGAILGYKSGEDLKARFLVTEGSHPGTGDNLISWGNYNFNGYTFHNANIVAKSLSVQGSKNCLQETKSYGARLINAYETAEYYFGDLGFGKINEDGECLVYIDDIFLECVNTDAEYHVFTQAYNGSIKTIERYKTYFIVKGEQGTSFSWELKAKRIGYENNRLDIQDIEQQGEEKIELFGYEDFKVKTSEDTLMNIITFELEDLLMEG